jgi:hypothetical protein
MRKLSVISFLILTAAYLSIQAQERVNLPLGVIVQPDRIEFKALEYHPGIVATNTLYEWQTVSDVRTNLYYGMQPDEVVTNTVRQQIATVAVVTNPANWIAPFEYTIPAGEPMLIAGALDARPQRKTVMDVSLILTEEQLQEILGEEFYLQTRTAAAMFGPLPVKGPLADALRGAVLAAMTAGGAQ